MLVFVGAVLLLCAGLMAAQADANLMENGSVQYAYLDNEEGLRQYIDADGMYASQENVKFGKYGKTYKIIIEESGELLICPLSDFIYSIYIKPEMQLYVAIGFMSQPQPNQFRCVSAFICP